jgi:ATP-dependent DNA helicase RecQ
VIIDTLLGSDRERILSLGMQHLTTYGLMKESDGPYIRQVIDRLLYLGALISTDDAYPILRLGDSARPILRGEERVTMMIAPERKKELMPEKGKKGRRSRTGEDVGLYAELKKLRQQIAAEEKVPAYVIFTNAALADMAIRCPRTKREFLEVNGVGQKKLERYGDAFLYAIEEYLQRGEQE